jgi:tetratricopeptide (TPR) repeat protein
MIYEGGTTMNRLHIVGGLLLGLAFIAAPALAQSGFIQGRVVDEEGNPVADAKLAIEYLGERTWNFENKTNKKGEYTQGGLYPGRYRIVVSKEGYETTGMEHPVILGNPNLLPDIGVEKQQTQEEGLQIVEVDLREKFTEAVELTKAGRLDEAEAKFNELREPMSDVPELYQNLGFLYVQKEDWAQAEENYLKSLELKPADPAVTSALAKVYEETGEKEKALDLVSKAAESNPEDAIANYNRGAYLLNAGRTPEAIGAFEAALAADPSLVEAHFHLASMLISQGKVPEAIEHLETYLAANPDNEQNVETAKGLIAALEQ